MENFSPVSGSLTSLLDSLHSNPQRTTMHQCPACGCLRIVSRMYRSELRLLKYGPGMSVPELQPGSGLSGSTLDSEDRESCCCICHLHDAPERSSRCVSPIQSERGISLYSDDEEHQGKCEKHDNSFANVDECCKCRSICTNLIQRVRIYDLCLL